MFVTAFALPAKVACTIATITIAILGAILRASCVLAGWTIEGSVASTGPLNAASAAIAIFWAGFHVAGVATPAISALARAH
jgi:hypothetical protein